MNKILVFSIYLVGMIRWLHTDQDVHIFC